MDLDRLSMSGGDRVCWFAIAHGARFCSGGPSLVAHDQPQNKEDRNRDCEDHSGDCDDAHGSPDSFDDLAVAFNDQLRWITLVRHAEAGF